MVLHLPDLGPSCYEIRDLPAPSTNTDQDKIGYISRNKHRRLRAEESDEQTNTEVARKKKVKKNFTETGDDSSSSDHSCFVALVTASNLHKDALYLPHDSTSSAGLTRNCSEIMVTDERERSWALNLSFNKSSDTFYISRGWRNFCDDNDKKAGGVFVFKLVGNGEMPLLSFCSTEYIDDGTDGDTNNKQNCTELERKKKLFRCEDSGSPSQSRLATLTLTDDNLRKDRRYLPLSFVRENGLDKPGMITLVGKDGTKWGAKLQRENTGKMFIVKGWKDFAIANGLKSGESFMLESILKKGTPTLSLFSTESTSDRSQQGECSKDSKKESISAEPSSENKTKKDRNNGEEWRGSSSAIQNRLVTLTLTPEDVRDCKLILPSQFMEANGINKLGKITVLGKNRMKWFAYLLSKDGIVALGCGWKGFCEANGVKTGESFTLECVYEQDTAPVFKFCSNSVE